MYILKWLILTYLSLDFFSNKFNELDFASGHFTCHFCFAFCEQILRQFCKMQAKVEQILLPVNLKLYNLVKIFKKF